MQLALIATLRSWGIHPSASCGHSSGEIPAAYASGILSFETAIIFAYYRGLHTSTNRPEASPTPGAMLAVGMSESEASKVLQDFKGYLTLAAVNSPMSCTISGDLLHIDQFEAMLDNNDIFTLCLDVSQAYHSHHMLRFETTYETMMKQCALADSPRPPTSPMFSSVTGRPVNWREMGPSYWTRNLVSPVRYNEALMGTVLGQFDEQQVDILLEIGPDPALKGPSPSDFDGQQNGNPPSSHFDQGK
ncbi:hypothetical protein QQS21_006900 [Conoideocrella luteorostrata]|uniref:Malonyl-CoA:ACP transacylase (MAT) domain-containing protein n=1 Tax=Conoideocrella luteorostrata TaxID=1105319 RepID=A0AAJ0FXI9_9HYPO|nr:hypothetical protein QQS21_006900 [Conoideocrella luteorostrata]